MAATVILGMQWGDEGKGKIVDWLAEQFDWIARFQGGNNAGHTIVVAGEKYVLRQLPSSVLRDRPTAVIGNGVVLNAPEALKEIELLTASLKVKDIPLLISRNAHLIMPYHIIMDRLRDRARKGAAIGTTGMGIGPCYSDKANRIGIRFGDLFDRERLRALIDRNVSLYNRLFERIYDEKRISSEEIAEQYWHCAKRLRRYAADTSATLIAALRRNEELLLEGAQGTYLDIDHGTYPFVTSSNATVGGAISGSGVAPRYIERTLGIAKAYTTRVGGGPFATELDDDDGAHLATRGNEFGSATSRPRRCGWLDIPQVEYAIQLNGVSEVALTKLDVLSGMERVQICVDHTEGANGASEPVYETMPGWSEDISNATRVSALPDACRRYLDRIGDLLSAPITIISVGPERGQTILSKE